MAGQDVPVAAMPPAVSVCHETPRNPIISRLRNRADFLRAAKALRSGQPAFLLQARHRQDGTDEIRVGFTCSKKVGNAVARNRAKRRLREAARILLPSLGHPGHDYVLVGRPKETATRDFKDLTVDLERALRKLHK